MCQHISSKRGKEKWHVRISRADLISLGGLHCRVEKVASENLSDVVREWIIRSDFRDYESFYENPEHGPVPQVPPQIKETRQLFSPWRVATSPSSPFMFHYSCQVVLVGGSAA